MTESLKTIQRESDQSLRRSRERRQKPARAMTFAWAFAGVLMGIFWAMIVLLLLGVVKF